MTQPTEPTGTPGSPPTPGETAAPTERRRLDRAPSERLTSRGVADPSAGTETGSDGLARAVAMGAIGAAVGIAAFLVLAIGFSFTAGLLVVALFTGRFIGLFMRAGAAGTVSSAARVAIAVLILLVALSVANLATWLWSHAEGGDLALGDYLDQAYGVPLVALEFMLGTLVAWWSAR
jgi:hypothetical protein